MKNKENKATVEAFNNLLEPGVDSKWRADNAYRKANKAWLKKSARIAIRVNRYLKNEGMTQKTLAQKMDVSPQQVNKILRGKENLTLETISKLELVMGIDFMPILKENEIVIDNPFANMDFTNFIEHSVSFAWADLENEIPTKMVYSEMLSVSHSNFKTSVQAIPKKSSIEHFVQQQA